jgi:hypothetical protein
MATCGDCGRPIDWALGPQGQLIKLDSVKQLRGEGRFVTEFEEGKPIPKAIPVAADREDYAQPDHATVCGKAFV